MERPTIGLMGLLSVLDEQLICICSFNYSRMLGSEIIDGLTSKGLKLRLQLTSIPE
jgi:hypothetical protein